MITSNTQLKDMIHVERGIIQHEVCDMIVDQIQDEIWSSHGWSDLQTNEVTSHETKELDVLYAHASEMELLYPYIQNVGLTYENRFDTKGMISEVSRIRYNRYTPGQIMRPHIDHIKTLFDGKSKGIPVLSFIGNLNDNYNGANLTFWDNYTVHLEKGDIVVWPSLFLYPHYVTESTEGTRYSFVCWAF